MLTIIFFTALRLFVINLFVFSFRTAITTTRVVSEVLKRAANATFTSKSFKGLLTALFTFILRVNLLGNLPFRVVPTMFYRVTLRVSVRL
jgi:hypothetical protein